MRRSALPSVWPKPRSSGSATSAAKRAASLPAVTCSFVGRISSCQFFWIVTVFHPWASRRGDDVTGVGDLAGKSPAAFNLLKFQKPAETAGDFKASNPPVLARRTTVYKDRRR